MNQEWLLPSSHKKFKKNRMTGFMLFQEQLTRAFKNQNGSGVAAAHVIRRQRESDEDEQHTEVKVGTGYSLS